MVVVPDRFRNTYRMTFSEHVNYKKTNLSPQIFEYLSQVILYNLRAEKNREECSTICSPRLKISDGCTCSLPGNAFFPL